MKNFLIFFLLFFPLFLSAQTNEVKVLNDKLKMLNSNVLKINYLDSVVNHSIKGVTLVEANHQLGIVYYKNNLDFNLANIHLKKALSLVNNDNYKKTKILLSLGFLNKKKVKNDSVLYFFNRALAISKTTRNNKLISQVYGNIAHTYDVQEIDSKLALKFYKEAIVIGEKSNRKLGTTYNNLGFYFLEKNVDSAIVYFEKSLKEAIKNKSKRKEIRAYTNLGIAYFENNKYNKAFKILKKVEKIAINNSNNTYLLYINLHLAKYYDHTKEYQISLNYFNKVYKSSYLKTRPLQYIEVLKDITLFYEKQDDYKKAYNFQKKYHQLKDSIFSVEKNKNFNEIKTKYNVEKKEKEINLLTNEKKIAKTRNRVIIITVTSLLLLLLLFIYFLRHKIKAQKIVREKEQALFNQELKTKKALSYIEGQETEQHRLAKELHDGLSGQLAGIKSIIQTMNKSNLQKRKKIVDTHLVASIKNLRNISHDLSAVFFKEKQFHLLLKELVKKSFKESVVQTEISIFPTQTVNKLPKRYKLNIYRILQESFQNILKHAKANSVSISLIIDKKVNLLIEDNGVGFDANLTTKGIGLQNIKDRLESFNGTLIIDSKVNNGTTLNINIPLYD